jgi:hypothetical protein
MSDDNNYNVVTWGTVSDPSLVHFIELERVGWYLYGMKFAPPCVRGSMAAQDLDFAATKSRGGELNWWSWAVLGDGLHTVARWLACWLILEWFFNTIKLGRTSGTGSYWLRWSSIDRVCFLFSATVASMTRHVVETICKKFCNAVVPCCSS